MFRLSSVVVLCFCLVAAVADANEGGGEHSGAPAATAEKIPFEEKQQQERTKEWMEVVTSLSALKTKIKSKEETIKEIIHHKNSAKNKAEAEALVGELLREHKELTKLLEDYNQSAQLLRYRYPDVGITEKRKYEKIEIKSIDDYEDAQTIEGQVKKTVAKVKTHYGVKEEKKPVADVEKKPSIDNNNLAQPKILKK
tara:strand:+ start:30453 stop:31043 length:591 start_codon:yes stop_codon:yes gene_type:complete